MINQGNATMKAFTETEYNQDEVKTVPLINPQDLLNGHIKRHGGPTKKLKGAKDRPFKTAATLSPDSIVEETPQDNKAMAKEILKAQRDYLQNVAPTRVPPAPVDRASIPVGPFRFSPLEIVGAVAISGVVFGGVILWHVYSNRASGPEIPKPKSAKINVQVEEVEEEDA